MGKPINQVTAMVKPVRAIVIRESLANDLIDRIPGTIERGTKLQLGDHTEYPCAVLDDHRPVDAVVVPHVLGQLDAELVPCPLVLLDLSGYVVALRKLDDDEGQQRHRGDRECGQEDPAYYVCEHDNPLANLPRSVFYQPG